MPNSVFKPYAGIGTNLLFFEKGEPTQEVWFYEHSLPKGQKAYSKTKPIRADHFEDCVAWWGGQNRDGRKENENAWRIGIDEIKAKNYNLDFKNPNTIEAGHGDPQDLLKILKDTETEISTIRNQFTEIISSAFTS